MGSIEGAQQKNNDPISFQPLQVRGMTLRNRIIVSPMGMYSSQSPVGQLTDFHLMHYGHFAFRGAALTIVEGTQGFPSRRLTSCEGDVTAVLPNGRSSPADAGLWDDAQISSFKRVVDLVHGFEGGQAKIGIQLGHAGRKASMMPVYPGQPIVRASASDGGWEDEVWGPSPMPFDTNYVTPKEMSIEQIRAAVDAFGDAAKRAVEAGFDFIEIHAAHGYLLSSFLSPASNHRTDLYGGSFQNRTRFLFEVVRKIRQAIPDKIAFSVRISAVDWMAHSPFTPQWTLEESVELALALADMGVDVLDVSSGGNNIMQQVPKETFYQISLAEEIKFALREQGKEMFVGAVGRIGEASIAEKTLREKGADLALVATQFLRDPNLVYRWSEELGAHVQWPRQYCRADRKAKAKENL